MPENGDHSAQDEPENGEKTPRFRQRDVDGGWAWMVLLFTCLYQMLCGMVYTTGLFNIMFLDEFGKNRQTTAWIGAVQASSVNFYGPLSAALNNHIGGRNTVILGGVVAFAGLFLSYFATNFVFIFLTFGVLLGLGSSISYVPWVVTIGNYFDGYRNLAYGISSASVGIGTLVLAPFVQYLEREYGWRGCVLILSAIYLNTIAVGLVYVPQTLHVQDRELEVETEPDVREHVDKNRKYTPRLAGSEWMTASIASLASIASNGSNPRENVALKEFDLKKVGTSVPHKSNLSISSSVAGQDRDPIDVKEITLSSGNDTIIKPTKTKTTLLTKAKRVFNLVSERKLLALSFNVFCMHGSTMLVYLHLPDYFRLKGASHTDLALIMAMTGASSTICRLLVGLTSNSTDINVLTLYLGCGLISGLLILLCPTIGGSFKGQMAFAVCYGLYGNAYNCLMPVMTLELCQLENMSVVYGVQLFMCGVSGILAPPFGGWLFDVSGDYTITYYFAGSMCTVGSLAMMCIPIVSSGTHDDLSSHTKEEQEDLQKTHDDFQNSV